MLVRWTKVLGGFVLSQQPFVSFFPTMVWATSYVLMIELILTSPGLPLEELYNQEADVKKPCFACLLFSCPRPCCHVSGVWWSSLCSIDQEIRQPLKTYARHVEISLMTMLMPCNFLLQKCVNNIWQGVIIPAPHIAPHTLCSKKMEKIAS